MPDQTFRVAVRNNHFPRMGEKVVLGDEAQEDWAEEIAKGFLVPIDDPETIPAPEITTVPVTDMTGDYAEAHGTPLADGIAENAAADAAPDVE